MQFLFLPEPSKDAHKLVCIRNQATHDHYHVYVLALSFTLSLVCRLRLARLLLHLAHYELFLACSTCTIITGKPR